MWERFRRDAGGIDARNLGGERITASGPIRTCVGCRAKREQQALLRVALGGQDGLVLDRRAPGRGAWLCAETALACFEQAVKKRAFARTLKGPVPDGAVESLRRTLTVRENMEGRAV
ncbi:MAG TPA: YlxR family protein [Actinomycetota bacterium]|nr:YlxR family protein [Actinomycetota bacterium]